MAVVSASLSPRIATNGRAQALCIPSLRTISLTQLVRSELKATTISHCEILAMTIEKL
jgi:hypothetical protein